MKHLFSSCLLAVIASTSAATAQNFINLDFESATVQPMNGIFLDWNLAAPGWNHSTGSSTSVIYYQQEHVGIDQIYLLKDYSSPLTAPNTQLDGDYSLSFASGYNVFPVQTWVNAYISQSGAIPASTHSVWMLATGPFQVLVNNTPINMISMGGNSYAGDVSPFAGTVAELKIQNMSSVGNVHQFTVVDDISFSPTIVPEPSIAAMLSAGAFLLLRRKVRTS